MTDPPIPRLLCGRCLFATESLTAYTTHIATHYKHVSPPSPPAEPEWHPSHREIL